MKFKKGTIYFKNVNIKPNEKDINKFLEYYKEGDDDIIYCEVAKQVPSHFENRIQIIGDLYKQRILKGKSYAG